jgi:hypothetical protein
VRPNQGFIMQLRKLESDLVKEPETKKSNKSTGSKPK